MFWVFGIYDLFYFFRGPVAALMSEKSAPFLIGGGLILTFAIAYLLGSVNFALLISRAFFHDDVRTHGSGNAGTTNVLRTYGKKAAALTFLGDGLKGVLAIAAGSLIFAGVPGFLQTAVRRRAGAHLPSFRTFPGRQRLCHARLFDSGAQPRDFRDHRGGVLYAGFLHQIRVAGVRGGGADLPCDPLGI